MNFLITYYIYPIREKFLLSGNLGIYFDNPRTDEEVEAVTEYIHQAYSIESAFQYSEKAINQALQEFLSHYSQKDEYISEFRNAVSELSPYEILAKMWIVARYDDGGEHGALNKKVKELAEEGHYGLFMLEDDNPIVKNSGQLLDYCHLFSLLIHTEQDYEGRSFILDANSGWFIKIKPNHVVCILFFMFTAFSGERKLVEKDENRWLYFPAVKERLIEISKLIDNLLNSEAKDKLLYIAGLLKNAGHDIEEEKTKLVVLVSIMELLLTHNPKFDRYNVEDSINKQFQLKAATLIYLNDKSKNINHIKARLNEIYGLRSSIAHGDFKAITKYFETAKKKDDKFPIDTVIGELYIYLRAIITEYLLDDNFVDFLKDG